jgi:hypothetical protein
MLRTTAMKVGPRLLLTISPFESDDVKKAKVAVAAATGGLIFDFGPSTVPLLSGRVASG